MTMTQIDVDQLVEPLQAHKEAWARLPVPRKIVYLKELRQKTYAASERWVAAAVSAKGIPADSPTTSEEWTSGPWALLYGINRLIRSLEDIERVGVPHIDPRRIRSRADGQVVVKVFPNSIYDRILLSGISAEVWMQPEVTADRLNDTMALFYKQRDPQGRVALVLGAGNVASIAPLDVLYKMIVAGEVCVLKMNPVNAYLGTFFEEIFAGLIKDGFMRVAYGGADVGAALTTHPGVDTIHITGSDKTHDAIVFGTGPEGADRKRRNDPLNNKPVTSELGNVSPTIIVPGPWSDADIRFQAEHCVTQKMHNGGFNCIASQVLVLPESWERTTAFLEAVRKVMRDTPAREQYYSGTEGRRQIFADAHAEVETFDSNAMPRTLVANLDSTNPDEVLFNTEAFCNLYASTTLPGKSAAEFLRNAVAFSNDRLWGTLGANIIIHPATVKELGPAFEEAIAALRYGCVGVNAWTGLGFLLAEATWGAYPGHSRDNIQSGVGVVHNAYMFDKPQKSVIYQPFFPAPRNIRHGEIHALPKPPWFVTHRSSHTLARRLTAFEAHPGPQHLPGILSAALRA